MSETGEASAHEFRLSSLDKFSALAITAITGMRIFFGAGILQPANFSGLLGRKWSMEDVCRFFVEVDVG